MKSLSVKLGVILIGLAIFTNAEVWGADWKFLESWGGQEELERNHPDLNSLAGVIICCDTSSIVYPSKNIVKVWVRWYFLDKEPISSSAYSEIKDLDVCKGMEVLKRPSLTKLYEMNCKERVYETIKVYFENPKEGIHQEAKHNENPELFGYGEIPPDGNVSNVWKRLCK